MTEQRNLTGIAREIASDYKYPANVYASPYIIAMSYCNTIEDKYGLDSGKSIVLYFLANASSWRGPVARRVKAELKGMCK